MLLARDAALRRGSIIKVCAAGCDFERRLLSGRTKGSAAYAIPMTERLYERLLWACAGAAHAQEPLLSQYHPGARRDYHYAALQDMLNAAKARAGVTAHWSFHDLRRTAARALYERTHDLRKVQRLLSHASPMATLWYLGTGATDLDGEDLEPATERKEQIA